MSAVRAHLSALNGLGSSALSNFSLDEDTVTFKVRTSSVRGTVSVSLFESSSYPRTGGLAYAEGCDELLQAVESIAEPLSDRASLDNCVRLLCRALGGPPELSELLARLPASGGSGGGASCSGAAGSSSLMMANLDYDFARGAELENSLLRLRHQWEVKDQRRREERAERAREEEEAAAATAVTGSSASVAQKRKRPGPEGKAKGPQKQGAHQIFSAAEATRMLCNELFDLMKEQREGFTGVSADCVDFDIHAWRVAISDIKEGSPLQADLARLSRETGQPAALELELAFTPDMHPFYPVFVKVVRPRFEGVVAEAVMTHPAMTLQGWDPMKPVKWLLRLVQSYLEKHGRVAFEDTNNDPSQPVGCYSAAELAICRLELLSGVPPVWAREQPELLASRNAEVDLTRIRELNFGKRKEANAKAPWASGVGYGHSGTEGGPVWDVQATEKAQAQADVEMGEMLRLVTECVSRGELRDETLKRSCLRPLLWRHLHTASLLDVGSRVERTSMYLQLLALLRALAAWPALHTALSAPVGDAGSGTVLTALEGVRKQADFFVRTAGRAATESDEE
ncbi:ubiquitin-conjugating bir-domain enzyme, partial [Chrysochromulina tobinii]